jgi:carbonic anhydrase/acetyltransferase-like protein (isoleucine patch superfamily)
MLFRFDGKEPVIGEGTYVSETAQVIGDVKIGQRCYIGHGVILRGDYGTIEIGDETAIEEGVIVHAPPKETCIIGNRVTVGHGAILHGKRIGNSVTVGMGAILSIRSDVGTGSIVAEGTLVRFGQEIEDSVVVGGNPAKVVRRVTEKDKAAWDWAKEIYVDLAKKYLDAGMQRIDAT